MPVALMVPCYVDTFYPRAGVATLELLERLGVDVVYPREQTCCGQPMANSGCYAEARATEEHCAKVFGSFAYEHPHFKLRPYSVRMTGPSGSGDISGITVHPAQGVKTLTVILSPVREARKRTR